MLIHVYIYIFILYVLLSFAMMIVVLAPNLLSFAVMIVVLIPRLTYPQTYFVFCYDDSRTCPKCLSIVLGDLGAISVTAAGKDAGLVQESENLVGLV